MKIKSLHYQRNGVSGIGFYQCEYAHEGEAGLIATFEPSNDDLHIKYETCRAIDPKDLTKAYRGDVVAGEIKQYIAPMLRDGKTIYDLIAIINNDKKIVLCQSH